MRLRTFPPFEFYKIVWAGEVLVLLRIFGEIHLWSLRVQGFCLLGCFHYCFNFIRCNLSIQILILPDLFWEGCTFLGIYQIHPGCPVSWRIIVHNIFFYTILCMSLLSIVILLFISDFIYLGPFPFFLMSLIKDLSTLFIFSKN